MLWHCAQRRHGGHPPAPPVQPREGPAATHLPQCHLPGTQAPGEQEQGAEQQLLLQGEGVLGPPAHPRQPVPKHFRDDAGDVQEPHTPGDGGRRGVTCRTDTAIGDHGGMRKGGLGAAQSRCPRKGRCIGAGLEGPSSSYSPPGSGLSRVWLRTSSSTTSTARLGEKALSAGQSSRRHGRLWGGGAVRGSLGPHQPQHRQVLGQAPTCRHPGPCEHHRRLRRPCGRRTGARQHPGQGHHPPAEAPRTMSGAACEGGEPPHVHPPHTASRVLVPPCASPSVPTCPSRCWRMAVSCSLV